jgi:hypothetical protein
MKLASLSQTRATHSLPRGRSLPSQKPGYTAMYPGFPGRIDRGFSR